VALGRYVAVGEPKGGYLFMPPWSEWADWAKREIIRQRELRPALEVWVDGEPLLVEG
jgi:hypothetical protein